MRRPVAVLAVLALAAPAPAVIKVLTPLSALIKDSDAVLVATVEKVDPDKPSVVFAVSGAVKGKVVVERVPVNLTGDAEAKKDGHTKAMLDRLAPERAAVLFLAKTKTGYVARGFVDGTWFSMEGTTDGDAVRWSFQHAEPFLRRTFKGTSAELKEAVADAVAGRKPPPPVDEKEPPGFGPVAEKKNPSPGPSPKGRGEEGSALAPPSFPGKGAGGLGSSPLFAVIPSAVLIAPMAIIAALFPGVFARLAVVMKKWRALLAVASTNSTLAVLYYVFRGDPLGLGLGLPDSPWFAPRVVALYLLALNAVGLAWAGFRYRRLAAVDRAVTNTPSRNEVLILVGLAALLAAMVVAVGVFVGWAEAVYPAGAKLGVQESSGMTKEFAAIAVGLAVAAAYAGYRLLTRSADGDVPLRLSLSGEAVGLAAMLLFGIGLLVATDPARKPAVSLEGVVADAAGGPKLVEAKVFFETSDADEVMSGVTVAGDRVLFGTLRVGGFGNKGAVFCLDRGTGKEQWRFDDDGGLRPAFATPAVAGGQVFAGEGLHTDSGCRLFRLDLPTGKPTWEKPFATTSHTEGNPLVVNGKVYFSAGDDGLYCVTAADGKEVWHLKGGAETGMHVDTPAAVAGGRVFAGSGYRSYALFALDADTGKEVWKTPVDLRSFGPPLVLGDKVVYGLGTGNLGEDVTSAPEPGDRPEPKPAGLVVCVDAATGKEAWRFDTPASVHTSLAADVRTVYAACRNGYLYALDRATGKLRWSRSLGSALTSGPAAATFANGGVTVAVYAVSAEGLAFALRATDGEVYWVRPLADVTGRDVKVLSTPVVVPADADGVRRHVYFGGQLTNRNTGDKAAAVFRVEDTVGE